MKYTLLQLEKHPERCKEKLMNEIIEFYTFNTTIGEISLKNFAFTKADEIISDFLNDKLQDRSNNSVIKPFGLKHCKENNIEDIVLEYKLGTIIWAGQIKIEQ